MKTTFPDEVAAIDAYFAACDAARRASMALFAAKALPGPLATLARLLNARRIRRALGTTTAEAVRGIRDRRLAALLAARWGTYGIPPVESPFAVHALVTGSYYPGAYFPVGGPAKFAEARIRSRRPGGRLRP